MEEVLMSLRLRLTNPAKAELARLEVENAEDDLVQKTEVAIGLMRAVLENVCLLLSHSITFQHHSLARTPRPLAFPKTLNSPTTPPASRVSAPSKEKLKNSPLLPRERTGGVGITEH
jgi:hypothetical protein